MKGPLEKEKAEQLLKNLPVATLCAVRPDGRPYSVPVHCAFLDGRLYFHGKKNGTKMECIAHNSAVHLSMYEMEGNRLSEDGAPCGVSTNYESVLVEGRAYLAEGTEKAAAITAIVEKFAPGRDASAIPPAALDGIAVVGVEILELSGKFNRP